jgi:hypothetical protein
MIMLTIKLNENSKKGKAFLEFARPFFEESKNVKLVDSDDKELLKQVSTYNPEFVKKVLEAQKRGQYTTLDPNDVWGSLGLR